MRGKGCGLFITAIIGAILLTGCGLIPSGGLGNATDVAPEASKGMYAYECLDEREKLIYNNMEYALNNHLEKIQVETVPDESMKKVFYFVLKDHPEIFWCTSFNRNSVKSGTAVRTEFAPIYTMSKTERYNYKEKIDQAADAWLASVPANATDYDKAKVIFDTLVKEVDYVSDSEENQNIISVFVNKKSVCQGYAKAFQYMLSKVGIESTLVKGVAEDEGHVWNLVKLDGDYYYFDVTWGDPAFTGTKSSGDFINYAYFGVTTDEILRTHKIDDELTLPTCTATKDNYYVKEKLFFNVKNKNIVGDAIYNADQGRQHFVSLKFDSADTYSWAVDYFKNQSHVFDFYTSSKKVLMYNSDELRVMSVIFNRD